jgi:hypothetical protein
MSVSRRRPKLDPSDDRGRGRIKRAVLDRVSVGQHIIELASLPLLW